MTEPQGNKPTPDPTVLTTEQLERAVLNLKELIEAKINGLDAHIEEQFSSVDRQFQLVERQRVEQKADTKAAVDAAFSAAKEAVKEQTTASDRAITKSETAMLEQQKQMGITFTQAIQAVSDKIDELKSRIGRMESLKQGGAEQKSQTNASQAQIAMIIGAVGALLGIIIVLSNVLTGQ